MSKGTFYEYFEHKQHLLLALLDDDASALDREFARIASTRPSGAARVRAFAMLMTGHGENPARLQIHADLWAHASQESVRTRLAEVVQRRRDLVQGWVEEAVVSGELTESVANALASTMVALADGLMLHGALDASGYRRDTVGRALDLLLAGIEAAPT